MKDLNTIDHFEPSEKLVDVLLEKTQSTDPLFFRVLVAYYFAKVASMMRATIKTHDRGDVPVNMYAINLSPSGTGKGHSTNIIEEQVIHKFKTKFLDETFPTIAERNLDKIAKYRTAKKNNNSLGIVVDPDQELERVRTEFESLGKLAFSFDSGTTPAVKQMRYQLLMANAGSINLEIDEIGSNLLNNVDVLNTFLELFDVGKVKQKLTKNTAESKRMEEMDGRTPANMMLFGTPDKLLDGSKVEDELNSFLETGYARRCLFGFQKKQPKRQGLTPEEVYDMMTDSSSEQYLVDLSDKLELLAGNTFFGTEIKMSKDVALLFIEYRLKCESIANELSDHQGILKAEISHRYYKALKLAGTYAFIIQSADITEELAYQAIKLVEESGEAFKALLDRERPWVKISKYLANIGREVTQVDLVEDLPFYKGSEAQKRDLMNLAVAWGSKNNIIIRKTFSDNIEFFKGETLKETDVSKIKVSYSTDITTGYTHEEVPFDDLYKLVTATGYHYAAHEFIDGYRSSEKAIPGFNTVILDVDEEVSLDTAKLLLSEYKALFATTKRHTDEHNRFRIILPISHELKLNPKSYSKFMENVFAWLPFKVDAQTKNVSRKWEAFNGTYEYQDGELLDALLFVPETKKQEEQTKKILDNNSLTNLERWFLLNTEVGNRSNMMHRYSMVLVDSGHSVEMIRNSIMQFNSKLKDRLSEEEIHDSILVTVIKEVTKRDMEN